jgi:hypothetical protein
MEILCCFITKMLYIIASRCAVINPVFLLSSVTLCWHCTLLTIYVELLVSTINGHHQVPSHVIHWLLHISCKYCFAAFLERVC